MYRIAVDIGGTFTDCVVYRGQEEGLVTAKSPTVREDLARGVLDAVTRAAETMETPVTELLGDTEEFIHGSTVATNTMIERTGARTAYLTTAGHEDTLAIGKIYQKRAGLSEREMVHLSRLDLADPPLVPRELVLGVQERVDYKGSVVVPLADEEIERAVAWAGETGVEALAVCLLWSFLRPDHERALRDALARELPDVYVSASIDVAPVLGEYERGVTTALNSYMGPPISRYLGQLERYLADSGLRCPLLLMTAEGGVVSVERASDRPIKLVDSGPVGGTLGSRFYGRAYGERNVICTDVGGTSFDVSMIYDDDLQLDKEPVIDQYVFKIPKVAVKSIGAGGGSVAWVDELGVLKVGPQSAGADPGPACYGRGGTLPTVTDADLILGYIDPVAFLGGQMRLDADAARRAFEPLAERLGQTVEETAAGVHRILDAYMADLLRGVTIERGHDPRDFVLFAYGGAAASHASGYAADAGVKGVYLLNDATAFSALGMLTADLVHTFERGLPVRSPFTEDDAERVHEVFEELEDEAREQIAGEGDADGVELTHTALMRFQAQVHELEVECPAGTATTQEDLERMGEEFRQKYEQTYGEHSAFPDAGTEMITFRLTAAVPTSLRDLPRQPEASEDSSAARTGGRSAHFEGHGFLEADVYDGAALRHGNQLAGPAVVERYGDTAVIPPGFSAEVDRYGNLLILSTVPGEETLPAAGPTVAGAGEEVDPITYEVIRNRLWAINDEQALTAAMTSGSTFIYEAFDFNSGLTDAAGDGIFAGTYILFHTTALDMAVQGVRDTFDDIKDGDMFVTNDPWVGAIHYNDVVTVTPIFADDGELVAWGAIVMHDQDVGGPVPGSFVVGATNVWEECPMMPPLRLMDGGRYCKEIEDLFLRNSRTPVLNALNFRARVASQSVTRTRIKEVIRRYGKETFKAAVRQVQQETRERIRARLREIPDGEWFSHVYLDHDGVSKDNLYEVRLRLEKADDRLIFDFTGSAPQAQGMLNGTQTALRGGVMVATLQMLCYDVPWAVGGLKEIIEIRADQASVVNADYPAGVSGASIGAEEAVENVSAAAVGRMLACSETYRDEEAMAVWYPYFNVAIHAGVDQYGGPLATIMFDNSAGGGGARSWKDGVDCGGFFECVSAICPNVESNERTIPVLELYRKRRPETYGHGKFRGGTGVEVAVIPHDAPEPLQVVIAGHGAGQPQAPGLYGGYPSAANGNLILRDVDVRSQLGDGRIPLSAEEIGSSAVEVLESKDQRVLNLTDAHVMWVSGGSGYADPLLRDPELVERDLRQGLCTPRDAKEVYGVAMSNGRHDPKATQELREELHRRRLSDARPVSEAVAEYGTLGIAVP